MDNEGRSTPAGVAGRTASRDRPFKAHVHARATVNLVKCRVDGSSLCDARLRSDDTASANVGPNATHKKPSRRALSDDLAQRLQSAMSLSDLDQRKVDSTRVSKTSKVDSTSKSKTKGAVVDPDKRSSEKASKSKISTARRSLRNVMSSSGQSSEGQSVSPSTLQDPPIAPPLPPMGVVDCLERDVAKEIQITVARNKIKNKAVRRASIKHDEHDNKQLAEITTDSQGNNDLAQKSTKVTEWLKTSRHDLAKSALIVYAECAIEDTNVHNRKMKALWQDWCSRITAPAQSSMTGSCTALDRNMKEMWKNWSNKVQDKPVQPVLKISDGAHEQKMSVLWKDWCHRVQEVIRKDKSDVATVNENVTGNTVDSQLTSNVSITDVTPLYSESRDAASSCSISKNDVTSPDSQSQEASGKSENGVAPCPSASGNDDPSIADADGSLIQEIDDLLQETRSDVTIASTKADDTAHFAKVGKYLLELYRHDQMTDVTVVVETYTFSAHSVVLACHSPYFADLFRRACQTSDGRRRSADDRVTLERPVTSAAFQCILEYMYGGELALTCDNAAELQATASHLEMVQVTNKCSAYISRLAPVDLLQILQYDVNKTKMSSSILITEVPADREVEWRRVCSAFLAVSRTEHFLNMNVQTLCMLLSRDDLCVTSEVDVAMAAVRWLEYARDERMPFVERVMSTVRLPLMSVAALTKLGHDADWILTNGDLLKKVMEAIWYSSCAEIGVPCKLPVHVPRQRHWKGNGSRTDAQTDGRIECKMQSAQPHDPPSASIPLGARCNVMTVNQATGSGQHLDCFPVSWKTSRLDYRPSCMDLIDNQPEQVTSSSVPGHTAITKTQPQTLSTKTQTVKASGSKRADSSKPSTGGAQGEHRDAQPTNGVSSKSNGKERLANVSPGSPSALPNGLPNALPSASPNALPQDSQESLQDSRNDQPGGAVVPRHPGTVQKVPSIITVGGFRDRADERLAQCTKLYHVTDHRWQNLSNLPHPRTHHAVAALHGFIYVTGGCEPPYDTDTACSNDPVPMDTVFCFDRVNNTWRTLAPLHTARMYHCAAALRDYVVVVGGQNIDGEAMSSVECYDPRTDTWTELPSLMYPRLGAGATTIDNTIVVAGGYGPVDNVTGDAGSDVTGDNMAADDAAPQGEVLDSVEYFSMRSQSWQEFCRLPEPRCYGELAVVNDALYLIGGFTSGGIGVGCQDVNSLYVFDDAHGTWWKLPDMPQPRYDFGVSVIGSRIYLIGGISVSGDAPITTMDCYNVAKGVWEASAAAAATVGTKAITLNETPSQNLE